MKHKKTIYSNNRSLLASIIFLFVVLLIEPGRAITLTGPITANSVTISGDVVLSSMTVSTLTVSNIFSTPASFNMPGRVVQIKVSSNTTGTVITTTTWTTVYGSSQS